MATVFRQYPEVPANVEPDVPHWTNQALRAIDKDMQAEEDRRTAADRNNLTAAREYADAKDADNRSAWAAADKTAAAAAKTYTDEKDATRREWAAAQDDSHLEVAKYYARTEDAAVLSGAKTYTDEKDTAARSAWAAADKTAAAAAKTYTDEKDTAARARLTAIEGRELPNRGRLYPAASAPAGQVGYNSIDDVVIPGTYAIWTAADALALGITPGLSASLRVYAFGNTVEQVLVRYGRPQVLVSIRRRSGALPWEDPTQLNTTDEAVAAYVKSGAETRKAISAMITEAGGTGAAKATKTAAMSLSTGAGVRYRTVTNEAFRLPFKVAAKVHRFRVHIQNTNPRYGTAKVAGALSFRGLGLAAHATGTLGRDGEGQAAGTISAIAQNFTTDAAGNEYVSPWVETGLERNREYLLTGGYTAAEGQQVVAAAGGGWVSGDAADWNKAAPEGQTITAGTPFYVWLELVVDADVPVIMYFGDSIASGVSARLGMYDSWPNKHALTHGHIATHYTNSGTTMLAHEAPDTFLWTRYASAANLAKPDACWFVMGSNDVFGGATLEDMHARFDTCLKTIQTRFTETVAVATIKPRHVPEETAEAVRKAWNEYLLTEAPERVGVLLASDAAALVTNPDGSTLMRKYAASDTDIHLTAAGYSRFMQAMPALHG